jgi:uncharacterized repeat protein (TIGR01451 family)
MSPLRFWIVGGLIALASIGRIDFEQLTGSLPASFMRALSQVVGNAETFSDPPPTVADVSITLQESQSLTRPEFEPMNTQFALTVRNAGPAPATNVRVISPVPTGALFKGVLSGPCRYVGGENVVSCTFPSIQSGGSASVSIEYTIPHAPVPCTQTLTLQQTAMAWSDMVDAQTANNQSLMTTKLLCATSSAASASSASAVSSTSTLQADLSVFVTAPAARTVGQSITYNMNVSNNGPYPAPNVRASVVIPPGSRLDPAQSDPRCMDQNGTIVCTTDLIDVRAIANFPLTFQTSEQTPCGTLRTSFTVSGYLADPVPTNNLQAVVTELACPAPVASSIPSSAVAVSSFSSAAAVVSSVAISRPTASAGADLEVAAAAPSEVMKGQKFTHTLTVKNNGPETAQYLAVYDPMGNGFSFDPSASDTRCVMEGGNVKCVPAAMAPGASETFVISINTSASHTCNALYIIWPALHSYTPDPYTVNNRVKSDIKIICGAPSSMPTSAAFPSSSSPVTSATSAMYSSTAQVFASSAAATDVVIYTAMPSTINLGDSITYNAQVWNNGPSIAKNVRLIDAVPSGLEFVPAQSDTRCALQNGAVTCSIPQLSVKGLDRFNLTFKTSVQMPCGVFRNTFTVQSDAVDSYQANNQYPAATQVLCAAATTKAAVSLTNGTLQTNVGQGGTIIYNFTASNFGPDAASDVVVTQKISPGFSYLDAQSDERCDQNGSEVRCVLGTLAVKQQVLLGIALMVNSNVQCGVTYQNTISVSTTSQNQSYNAPLSGYANVLCPSTARLSVAVQGAATDGAMVKNQKNVSLMRFVILGDPTSDTGLKTVRFVAAAGSLSNAQNYTLYADMDYNGTPETGIKRGVAPVNNTVSFNVEQMIAKSKTMVFEVHADVVASPTSDALQMAFDTSTSDYITAFGATSGAGGALNRVSTNGVCPAGGSCQIFVAAVPGTKMRINPQGDLYVTKDTEFIRSKQLLGGVLGDSVLRMNFRAPNEDVEVTQLQISTWESVGASVDRLELTKPGDLSPFAIATTAACGTQNVLTTNPMNGKSIRTYCAVMQNRELIIPTWQETDVIVRPMMRNDDNGGISGEPLTFWLPSRAGTVQARGVGTQSMLITNDGDMMAEGEIFVGTNVAAPGAHVVGNLNQAVLSKIIIIYNNAPNPGKVIVGQAQEIGRFGVGTSNSNNPRNGLNKPVITDVLFNVLSSGIGMNTSTFKVVASTNPSTRKDCSVIGTTAGETLVSCRGLSFTVDPMIDLSLQVDVTSGGGSSWVQASLKSFTEPVTTFGSSSGQSRIRWEDKDAFSTAFFWIDQAEPTVNSSRYIIP